MVVSRVFRVYLLACKRFSVVIDHATLTPLLTHPGDKLNARQVHWVERLMSCTQRMSILYRKGSVNEADVVPRRPDLFHSDDVHMRKQVEMFAL